LRQRPVLPAAARPPSRLAELRRISHQGSGRAGLQPRRYKAFLINPVPRAPRSPASAGLRGARDQLRAEGRAFGGAEAPPFRQPLQSVQSS
jgi:hypothetical protein